ncbi:hypothetical protein K2173_010246 [Erythroxylum novogranatense]|uniref:COBRA C-terminal domain-containing protein n=1 Tax=Erythroxylum novogranatense TaxID=1862640 RepID=A0AAV8UD92_9ROSI|nr:hypothetical protein K2173_010246 [Erythroxylum novogranatense]
MAMANNTLFLFVFSLSLYNSLSQQPLPNASCNGVVVTYTYDGGYIIPPTETDPTNQAYRFESTLAVRNNGRETLKSWKSFVRFQYNELLVSITGGVLAVATVMPAPVGNGTELVGSPVTDLKSAIETAGDVTQMEAYIKLVGTQFGNGNLSSVLPANLSLSNEGYSCPVPSIQGNVMQVCCIVSELTDGGAYRLEQNFEPLQNGDLTIMYDVLSSYDTNYWAQVTISNHNPVGRLENWKLSWDWTREEFIYTMKGAYPHVLDTNDCIFGQQGQHYKELDFSQVLSCERRPTITDLPPTRANDSNLGRIPFCCRNGTILPPGMDPSKAMSIFQMQVYKMPPDLNRTALFPPQNWKINGTWSSDFECGVPVAVTPTQFPDPNGLPSEKSAVASWQVVCNVTHFKEQKPKCCVSFSAFYNDSVVPCRTCACGCNDNPSQTCNSNEPALLLPSRALLVPFENRTSDALDWASTKRFTVPNPPPCGDNCGVSINWHVLSDYRNGWTARITIFNWGENEFVDWFATVQLDKAMPGFEKVYSLNGSAITDPNNTIFMQGFKDLNYLLAETDRANPRKDPRIPGTQQSVISFTKKTTPLIKVAAGDGFPTKVLFNGEECALPSIIPSRTSRKTITANVIFGLLPVLLLL